MNRLPTPFSNSQGSHQGTSRGPQHPASPGFLLLTRPPTGANSYGGANYQSPSDSSQSFIPFSNVGNNNVNADNDNRRNNYRDGNKYGLHRGGGSGGGGGPGGGGGRHGYPSPRFAYPYQQSPSGRMPNSRSQDQGFNNSPGGQYNQGGQGMRYSTPRGNFNNNSPCGRFHSGSRRGRFSDHHERSFGDHNRSNPNGNFRGGRGRGYTRGPISSIPIDKFIIDSMVRDPWAGLEMKPELDMEEMEELSPSVNTLEDSEIIIDSDLSATVEKSYEDVLSDTEVDSSPVHDTGSDSPNVATSSTSEKDTGSDSESDAD